MLNEPCRECWTGHIEWADRYCQDCWEKLCSREWWLMVAHLKVEDELSHNEAPGGLGGRFSDANG